MNVKEKPIFTTVLSCGSNLINAFKQVFYVTRLWPWVNFDHQEVRGSCLHLWRGASCEVNVVDLAVVKGVWLVGMCVTVASSLIYRKILGTT